MIKTFRNKNNKLLMKYLECSIKILIRFSHYCKQKLTTYSICMYSLLYFQIYPHETSRLFEINTNLSSNRPRFT